MTVPRAAAVSLETNVIALNNVAQVMPEAMTRR